MAPIVTTSWDDGHPIDLEVAELLAKYGLKGTFYIPVRNPERRVMSAKEVRELRGMGMEVGAHTASHRSLAGLSEREVRHELYQGKAYLEDVLGEEVSSFCYPKGHFTARVAKLVRDTGYCLARTTVAFRLEVEDRFRMPVTFQLYPHSRFIHLRRGIKEMNWTGLARWLFNWNGETDLLSLTNVAMDAVLRKGGVFHLWGHSWEIKEQNLWSQLQDILKLLSERAGVVRVETNVGVLKYARSCPP